MKRLIAAFIGAALHTVGLAGPFGLEMGMTVKDLQAVTPLRSDGLFRFTTKSPPNGHPDLVDYGLTVTPVHGLCKISASTAVIPTGADGAELQSAFNRFYGILTKRYGTSKRYDNLRSESSLIKPDDWMMALRKKDRTLVAYWIGQELQLPDDISGVMLETVAAGPSSGFIYLTYEFKNSIDCLEWIQVRKANQL